VKRTLVAALVLFLAGLGPASAQPEPPAVSAEALRPAGEIQGRPLYIGYAVDFQHSMPELEKGKTFRQFDDQYGAEQEAVWIWFSGGVEEVRLYALKETDSWDKLTLGRQLFSVPLGADQILAFLTQIPEGAPPRAAVWFETPDGPRAYALGYSGQTGAVRPVEMSPEAESPRAFCY
jgi:hypothetical protein